MAIPSGVPYQIIFPEETQSREVITEITDHPDIPDDHFIFELWITGLHEDNRNNFKLRLAGDHMGSSYAICSNGKYRLVYAGNEFLGYADRMVIGDTIVVRSHPIPVNDTYQWVKDAGGFFVLPLYFTRIPAGVVVDLSQDDQPVPAVNVDEPNGNYFAAFPVDIVLEKDVGTEEKKMPRKKVKTIWKEDR